MMIIRFFLLFSLVAIAVGTLQSSGNPNEKFIWVQQGSNIDGLAEGDETRNPSLSADGLTVAVTGRNHDGPNGENSAVNRVFKLVNNVWVQQGGNIDGLAEGDLAWPPSLSADGLTVAVAGEQHDGPNGEDSGVTRVLKLVNNVWVQQGGNIDGLAEGDEAGSPALSADGLTVAVTGLRHDGPNGEDSGVTRVFKLVNNVWVQQGGNDELYGYCTYYPFIL
jgi:hypothetical protein